MAERIRVMLVDDHLMFGEALELLIGAEQDIEMVGSVRSGEEAIDAFLDLEPDVVLVDIDLPGMDGIELTRALRTLDREARIVLVTAFQRPDVIARAMAGGALAYLPKTRAADELKDVIRRASRGEPAAPSESVGEILARMSGVGDGGTESPRARALTARELEVLQALAEGRSVAEIAGAFYISPATVRTHVKSIMSKLDVHSTLEAVTFALRSGMVRLRS